jgi:hypothetical protein
MHPDIDVASTGSTAPTRRTAVNRHGVFTSRLPREGPALLLLGAWLAYTRMYFVLHPLGLTFAPSLFMRLTGRPDPACGLTRTFAWMWRGDLLAALRVYPIGPLLFLLAFAQLADSMVALLTGWRFQLARLRPYRRPLIAFGIVTLAINWILKLVWLGI